MYQTSQNDELTTDFASNISRLKALLPIDKSFDFISDTLQFSDKKAFFLGINGMCDSNLLLKIFVDLQAEGGPAFGRNLEDYIRSRMGFAQVTIANTFSLLVNSLLSGPCILLFEDSDRALIIDSRIYPTRGISEPDGEQITKGPRDGFVETLITNTNLIRRRLRTPELTFEMHRVGSESKTDIALAYLNQKVNPELLDALRKQIDTIKATTLTMDSKSLEELLVKKRWWNPLPSMQMTERPDLACSYLAEGHILIIVDNSPLVLILPCTIFQFTQSPEDYYKSPLVGTYYRLVRFLCIPVTLLLIPVFLLLTVHFPQLSDKWQLISTEPIGPVRIIFYVYAVEFLINLFQYSAALSSSHYSSSLSIIGGLIISDMAVNLKWASLEVLFYAAVTLLSSLALASTDFADAIKVYRLFLTTATALLGLPGFVIGLFLIMYSAATTPTFGGMSYFWPLFPYNAKALHRLLFRLPTFKVQPSRVWDRGAPDKEKY